MNKKSTISYSMSALMYTFSYMAIGAMMPMIAQHLSGIGFDGMRIGIITATGTLTAIFAVTFWGKIYSSRRRKIAIIELLCIGTVIMGFLVSGAKSFAPVLLLFGGMYFFQAPIMSLIDSLTVLNEARGFGGKRAWGAVGFALGIFVCGILVDMRGAEVLFLIYGFCFIFTFVILAFMRRRTDIVRIHLYEASDATYRDLFKEKKVAMLLACMFFMGGTNAANNTYFSFLYIDGGGTIAGVGIAMLLMVGSEVPFMAWCDKLSGRFGMERLILAAMTVSVIRFLTYGLGLPWWALVLMFVTQGMVNGIILVEFVRYIAAIAPPGCKSLAISSYYIIGGNISTILCQIIGGVVLDAFGSPGVYTFFGLFNLVGVCLYMAFKLYKPVESE